MSDRDNGRPGLYRPAPWLVVRTPLLPVDRLDQARTPRRALDDPEVVRALAIGSPDLLATLRRPSTAGRDLERAEASLARYLIRMSTRPTPYGAFAGVSLASWGPATTLALGPEQRLRTRPDMGWATAVLRGAEADPAVRATRCWERHPLVTERSGRLVLDDGAVSVKATRPARLALELAAHPRRYDDLRDRLVEATGGSVEQVETLLAELWRQGLLRTDLRPLLTGPAATSGRDLATRLGPSRAETAAAVRDLLDLMHGLDDAPPVEAPGWIDRISTAARALAPDASPVSQTDLARGLVGDRLHEAVAEECARAAELLLRITPAPTASPDLLGYTRNFLGRYGPDREVGLLELFDPAHGLGPMPHTHGGDAGLDPERTTRRADVVMDLALGALRQGARTVELTRATVQALQTWSPSATDAPLSLELAVFVLAESAEELDRGAFSVVLGPNLGASTAGRWLGRFADMLPGSQDAYAWLAAAEEAARPGPVAAEVVYLPTNPRIANVVVRPSLARYEIAVDLPTGEAERIELDDLVVGVRAGRLVLRSRRLGTEVRPTARHMLNHHGAPALCRFLDEVGQGDGPRLTGFSWGAAAGLPALPRVISGRVVLEPARWRFPVRARQGRVPELAAFTAAFTAWREQWQVPARVYASTSDNRLLLDLDESSDLAQLHREARQRPAADLILQEALPDVGDAWLPGPGGRYLSEIVVPLVLRPTSSPDRVTGLPTVTAPAPARMAVAVRDRVRPPGSDWLFAKFYLPADRITDLLTGPVADLCAMAENSGLAQRWFFLRYADPGSHLRIRWQGAPDRLLQQLLPQVTDFAGQLIETGRLERLVIDTYERELDRYGGPDGTDVSEAVFHADSATVQHLLALPGPAGHPDRTELAALTVHTLLVDLGLDAEDRLAFYRRQVAGADEESGRRAGEDYRQRKDRLRRALGPGGAEHLDPTGAVGLVLDDQRLPLRAAASRLRALAGQGGLTLPPEDLWPSYVHMHHNRLVGGGGQSSEVHLLHLLRRTQEGLLLSARTRV